MPKKHFSIWKALLLTGLLVVAGLFWLNDHIGYQAKSAILLDAKKEKQDDVLAKTVAAFAETDTFVQRTVGSTRLMESALGELPLEEQKKNIRKVAVKASEKKGGLIFITTENTSEERAKVANTESVETLMRMTRLYLGGENEVAIKSIDQAIVTKGLIDKKVYFAKTIGTALFIFVVLLALEPLLGKVGKEKNFTGSIKTLWNKIQRKKLEEKKKEEGSQPDERFVPQKLDPTFLYPETGEASLPATQPKASDVLKAEVYGKQEAAVPQQTPLQSVSVSMDDLPFTFETPAEEKSTNSSEETTEADAPLSVSEVLPADQEPSVLEYKRRLNELLAQK